MNRYDSMLVGLVASATTSTFAQLCGGWAAVLPIAVLAIYGWFNGVFLAVIAGLHVLASFLLAVAAMRPVAETLEAFGLPAGQSLAAAYAILFVCGVVGIRLAVGGGVPEGAVRFSPIADHVVGALLGGFAGAVLGGVLLVGWSFADMPGWFRFDPSSLPFDSGRRLLWTYARFASGDVAHSRTLFAGDRSAVTGDASSVIRASEPFVDANGNGRYDAAGEGTTAEVPSAPERYLDLDGNGCFTADMQWFDRNADGRRAIGLHDCYRLAEWRRVRCLHAPWITSADEVEVQEAQPVEEPIYRASATDVDGSDTISFDVEPANEGDELDVTIDRVTGAVTLIEPADFEKKKRHVFVVVAKDASGLVDEKRVSVRVRDIPLQ